MDDLYLGYNLNGYGAERILLRFNVEAIPRGATIGTAGLRLHIRESMPNDDMPLASELRPLLSSWDELAVRWRDGPERGSRGLTSSSHGQERTGERPAPRPTICSTGPTVARGPLGWRT